MSATWRLVIEDGPVEGATNMARDRAVQIAHSQGLVQPTLRLYRWRRPTVTLGKFQPTSDVDMDVCARHGVDVVRRFTGGRGVLHDDEVTYSVVAGMADGVPRGVAASYRMLCGMLIEAYRILGVPAEVTSRPRGRRTSAACYLHATHADLSVGTAKLSGSAQVWHEGTLLQHGSIVRTRDARLEASVFGLDDGGHEALIASTATLEGLLGYSPTDTQMCDALERGLRSTLKVQVEAGGLTDRESRLAAELVHEVQILVAE